MSNTSCSKHRGSFNGDFALKVPKSQHVNVNRARPNSTVIVRFRPAALTRLLNASTLPPRRWILASIPNLQKKEASASDG